MAKDFDFNIIYHQPTPEEQQAKTIADAKEKQHNLLYDEVLAQDYSKAANLLMSAGTCQWQDLAPGGDHFVSSYKFENGKTSLTISEKEEVGGNGFWNYPVTQYIPRLTVTADSCPEK